jgi:hypothetical protein
MLITCSAVVSNVFPAACARGAENQKPCVLQMAGRREVFEAMA